ncbi:unnamed protein product [Cyclocybe aegerita]|uniref:Uncharacterized protein n=1 Tax=Cyclocybe aegerita TaxID=1973307 RepID=A0A8S0VZU6_CYCAE|nr:unnamed protein product [Cyclocybe aegerita]
MPAKGDNENNSPEIKKPKPRRLFSFDSIKSAASSSSRRSSTDNDVPRGTRPLNPFDLSNVEERDDEKEDKITSIDAKKQETYFTSESATAGVLSPPPGSDRPHARLEPVRPISIAPTRPFSPNNTPATPSPTRVRWENLRQHVLPPSRPLTPPQRPPSAQSSVSSLLQRSTTPKPSRLGKLAFRQVVEGAQGIVDETRKFGEEILRACAIARYSEQQRSSKEKDASTTTLTGGTTTMSSAAAAAVKRMDYLRRPQSTSSVALTSVAAGISAAPSLRFLYQILFYHAGLIEEGAQRISRHLPHEYQVLSTLLCPFLLPTKYPGEKLQEEQITSVEAFELVSKSWIPCDEAAKVERCLWCIKAAAGLAPSPIRTRVLASLWKLLVSGDRNRTLLTVEGFQSISSGLLILLAAFYRPPAAVSSFASIPANFQQPPHPDIHLVQDVIQQFLSGSMGELEDDAVEEEYGVEFGIRDRRHLGAVRRAVFLEALVICMENDPPAREWLLQNAIEQYWPMPSDDTTLTTLQASICIRRLNTLCRLFTILLQHSMPTPSSPVASPGLQSRMSSSSSDSSLTLGSLEFQARDSKLPTLIASIIQARVIPAAEALGIENEADPNAVLSARQQVARILLQILCLRPGFASSPKEDVFGGINSQAVGNKEETTDVVRWVIRILSGWYRAGNSLPWREVLDKTFRQVITGDWRTSTAILLALLDHIPDDLKKNVFASIFPALNDQLVQDPPPYPFPDLTMLFTSLSRLLPPIFFKPMFACAASDKEVIVVNHLCTLQVHAKYVKDYWIRDVEMMCVALLGEAGSTPSGNMEGQWGSVRLGQLVLLVELIGKVQDVRHEKEGAGNSSDGKFIEVIRFVTALESRLWQTIDVKERKFLLPPSHRMLFCMLFREIRLLTRSSKPAPWLPRTLQWFDAYCADEHVGDLEQEVTLSVERIQGLYMAAQEGVQQINKRHISMLLARASSKVIPTEGADPNLLDLAVTFVEHRKLIDSLSKGYISRTMKLFVALSTLISVQDYQNLAPSLWQHSLVDNMDPSSTASACFLLMQCAEKAPLDLQAIIEVDLQTSDDMSRLEAVRKISILVNWRFQISSQNYVTDRNHRPFKLARPPLPFIAADMGTSLYVHAEDHNESQDKDDVPLELKKRLAELGWAEENAGIPDPRQEWIKIPLSILPANQMDRLEVGSNDAPLSPNPTPQPSPQKARTQRDQQQSSLHPVDEAVALLRRNSSSGGPANGVKRRAIFVPSLTLIFPRLASLVFDPNFMVASAARTTVLDLMRNDPALLVRPVLDFLVGEQKDLRMAISSFTAFLHIRRVLPPPLTHYIFNNLSGFLKAATRNVESQDTLDQFGQVAPILAGLATQVSGMTIREIRRSKIEHFFIPTGSLWFAGSAPKGPMFPRNIGPSGNPFEPVPPRLVSITMIRVSQNLFFLSMLKRNYQDVQIIRKNMTRLVLPSLDDEGLIKSLEMSDFVPKQQTPDPRPPLKNRVVEVLSSMVARSYILLVAQIFRSMPRHLSDRHELAILTEGLNRALLAHSDDITIISQVLIALMVAGTRFRRLFMTGGGYTLFMPALVKVYTEKPLHPGIRLAIEYAVSRFYALHKEAFLYQSVSTIGQLAMLPDIDPEWFSKGVYDLFTSLRKGATTSTTDMAGIHDVNKAEEREALILNTADETPQTFLSSMRRVESQNGFQMAFQVPDQYETHRLSMDDFVRLFLTVIAHDLSRARAQYFLRLLRLLSPHLYNASGSTRAVLADGIAALGLIITKTFAKPKGGETFTRSSNIEEDEAFLSPGTGVEDAAKEKSKVPSDSKAVRLDFLRLVLAFGKAGGQVSLPVARQGMDVVKSLLKDWSELNFDVLASILGDFISMLLNREEPPVPKAVVAFLQELSPILHAYMVTIDFTDVFETVLNLSKMPMYANDLAFSEVVVGEVCSAGLAACDLAASENQLITLQYRPVLVSLCAESIFLKGVDIIGELERRPPTYQFLAGVILPLTLAMKTQAQIVGDGMRTEEHRKALTHAWVRLLFYAMSACQKSRRDEDGSRNVFRGIGGSFRSKSDKGKQEGAFWRSHLPTVMTALQVIKVIMVRGTESITSLPRLGVWERLASFFKTMLSEGSGEFALKAEPSSNTTTPTGSPRSSSQFETSNSNPGFNLFVSTSSDLNRPGSPFSQTGTVKALCRPRMIDYSLWSVLEFVCSYRSPLRMQLKLLVMEKVIALDEQLQLQGGKPLVSGGLSPYPTSPSSRRVSTSIFSKARARASGATGISPDSSLRLMPSPSNLLPSPSMLDIPPRRAGYQISPILPQDRPLGMPKIVHLGPTSPSAFLPISSPIIGSGGVRNSRIGGASVAESDATSRAHATKIKSVRLIQETYRRIRCVQTFMGYDLLLPIPSVGIAIKEKDGSGEATLESWTKAEALAAIVAEMKDLLEEFEEGLGTEDLEDSVMVEVEPPTPQSPNRSLVIA